MQARLDELTCREVVARYLRPLQARVWRDDVTDYLVIEVFDPSGTERLLPRVSGKTLELPVHQADIQSAIGSIRDTLVTIAFDEELPAEGVVGFLKALG